MPHAQWRFTCRKGTWEAFGDGAMRAVVEEAADAEESPHAQQQAHPRLRDFLIVLNANSSDEASTMPPQCPTARTEFFRHTFTVDWTGFHALRLMRKALILSPGGLMARDSHVSADISRIREELTLSLQHQQQPFSLSSSLIAFRPNVFMNYRVFCNPALLNTGSLLSNEIQHENKFYLEKESQAMLESACTVALCPFDRQMLLDNYSMFVTAGSSQDNSHTRSQGPPIVHVILPPLRPEIFELASSAQEHSLAGMNPYTYDRDTPKEATEKEPTENGSTSHRHRYITCCVRLVPEKNDMLVANVMVYMGAGGWLQRLQLTPFLCGCAADPTYAEKVKKRLREVESVGVINDASTPRAGQSARVVIVDEFLSPPELAEYLKDAVLNFHPSLYDAYGMTIVEAAAFGVPSLIHNPEAAGVSDACAVGAQSLLSFTAKQSLPVNMVCADDDDDAAIARVAESIIEYFTQLTDDPCESNRDERGGYGQRARTAALSWTLKTAIYELLRKISTTD